MREALTVLSCDARGTRIVQLSGELNSATVPKLVDALAALEDVKLVLLELWEVSDVDYTGLRTLLAVHLRLGRHGIRLILHGVPTTILRVMEDLGLDRVLHLDSGEAD